MASYHRKLRRKSAAVQPGDTPVRSTRASTSNASEAKRIQDLVVEFQNQAIDFCRRKKKRGTMELLAAAYWCDVMNRIGRAKLDVHHLKSMDPAVARRALRVFDKPESAAVWLTTPLRQLWNKTPLECRPVDVLAVLGRMENGVFG